MLLKNIITNKVKPELIKNFIIYTFGAAAFGLSQFFLLPVLTHNMSPANYGQVELINTLVNFFLLIVMFGLPSLISVDYYKLDDVGRTKLYSGIVRIFLFLSIPGFLVFGTIIYFLRDYIFGTDFSVFAFVIAIFGGISNLFFGVYLTTLQISKQSLRFSVMRSLQGALMLGITLICIHQFLIKIPAYFLALLSSNLIGVLFAYFGLNAEQKKPSILKHYTKMKDIFKYSVPFLIGTTVYYFIMNIDRWVILHFMDQHNVGIYGSAYRFGQGIEVGFIMPVMLAYVPHNYEKFAKGDFYQNFKLIIFLSVICFSLFAFLIPKLAVYLIPPDYYQCLELIPMIIIGYMFYFLNSIFVLPVNFLKNSRLLTVNYISAASIHFVLNILLVPAMGIKGSAYAFMASNFVWMIMSAIFGKIVLNKK